MRLRHHPRQSTVGADRQVHRLAQVGAGVRERRAVAGQVHGAGRRRQRLRLGRLPRQLPLQLLRNRRWTLHLSLLSFELLVMSLRIESVL